MKTKKTKKLIPVSESWISPAKSITQDEFLAGIQKAGLGPFSADHEPMENFELWVKSREKK